VLFALIASGLLGCKTITTTTTTLTGAGAPLALLYMPHDGVAKHEGSWDRSGGNADFRPVEPGHTITLLDYRGAGVIRRFWCTIAPRADMQIHRQAILRMYWDEESRPA
jgi:hypothetical protein